MARTLDGWTVRRAVHALRPGDRFYFDEEFGGEGEVLTLRTSFTGYGTTSVTVEEWVCELEFPDTAMVTLDIEEGD